MRYKALIFTMLLGLVTFQAPNGVSARTPATTKVNCDDARKCGYAAETRGDEENDQSTQTALASDPDLEPGFPVKAWSDEGSCYGDYYSLVGNIDADPELEIVATGIAQGPLYAWNSDGTLVDGWPIWSMTTHYPTMGNLSSTDPGLEVVSRLFTGFAATYSGSGEILPGWPINLEYPSTYGVLADVDGDGLDEIFFESTFGVLAFRADGSSLLGWPASIGTVTPAIGDLDNDEDLEIVTAEAVSHDAMTIYAYHHDGTLVDGFPQAHSGGLHWTPTIGDVDGDGAVEIIVTTKEYVDYWRPCIRILSAEGNLERRIVITSTYVSETSEIALADMDEDNVPEILLQTWNAVHCWHGDGTSCSGWPQQYGEYERLLDSSPVVGDVDGDHKPEVVITTENLSSGATGFVRVYEHTGELHPRFPKQIEIGSGATPAISDIDLDGHNEIIITGAYWGGISGEFDKVWVYDLGGGQHGKIEWGQRGGNPQHRGFYPPPPTLNGTELYISTPSLILTPPESLASVPINYGNYGETIAHSATLTVSLDSQLTYTSDTSGITPTISKNTITWTLPSVAYFNGDEFTLYLQVLAGAEYGARFLMTGGINTSSSDIDLTNNYISSEIVIARQCFLPMICKQ